MPEAASGAAAVAFFPLCFSPCFAAFFDAAFGAATAALAGAAVAASCACSAAGNPAIRADAPIDALSNVSFIRYPCLLFACDVRAWRPAAPIVRRGWRDVLQQPCQCAFALAPRAFAGICTREADCDEVMTRPESGRFAENPAAREAAFAPAGFDASRCKSSAGIDA
ncbi:hypothetical protein QZM26_28520 [Burkholderia multivorans]|uniref:hypothetical protein n=1 Tax=Burkholderia multivorans TaxID=87883 RepID=UPI00155F7620|nr:hypothetical protein [Burkholderia multivorans]MBU9598158.1 hypothetical protein [Burkholderia multivorans]MCA8251203.1 hypothetical protein [Burkholderia multivorans]MDN7873348.1 hypothetical protein [Burkholderia multivorans]